MVWRPAARRVSRRSGMLRGEFRAQGVVDAAAEGFGGWIRVYLRLSLAVERGCILASMTYDEILKVVTSSKPEDWLHVSDSQVLKANLDVRITKELQEGGEEFHERWATEFPDGRATTAVYQLWHGSSPVERVYFATVDGARAALPYPKSPNDLRVSLLRYAIALAINPDAETFASYFNRAGLKLGEDV